MASDVVLVTGGAGFIGSHVVDRLVASGQRVRVLDALEPQVHDGSTGYRNVDAEYVVGSILDPAVVLSALEGVEAVIHLAAQVGVGQSMYDLRRYVGDNCLGTAVLLEALADRRDAVSALVVASSMSIYGEGRYSCETCKTEHARVVRTEDALRARRWEPVCRVCASEVQAHPTSERKELETDSIYAVTKRDQEELCLVFGRAYGIRTVALRFFNVYGPRQSLSNPYTGVAAIFISRLLNGHAPLVYEDGLQSRDFVHVADIARAVELGISAGDVGDVALNIGTGASTTVLDVATVLSEALELKGAPEIVQRYRQGDIRHCYADIEAARQALGYEPRVTFPEGMAELVEWISRETPLAEDRTARSTAELVEKGLVL